MEKGYLKLWRKSENSLVFQDPELWQLWTYCLMRASHKGRFVPLQIGRGKISVEVKKGQFIFGRNKVSEALNCKPSTLYKRMKKLVDIGNIKMQSSNQYSTITICNWELYQPEDTKREQPSNNQVTTKEQPSNTNKHYKNCEKEKKLVEQKKKLNGTPYKAIIDFLNSTANKNYKHTSKATQGHIKARFNEGFTLEDFKRVIESKVKEWQYDNEMVQYIRPQTLFGTKFESYLQASEETKSNGIHGEWK